MTAQVLDRISFLEAETSFKGPSDIQPLEHSRQSVLKQIDAEYERERDRLIRTLPQANVDHRALSMLKPRHRTRRKNYVRELAALVAQPQ
jgi:hypothetical protein